MKQLRLGGASDGVARRESSAVWKHLHLVAGGTKFMDVGTRRSISGWAGRYAGEEEKIVQFSRAPCT